MRSQTYGITFLDDTIIPLFSWQQRAYREYRARNGTLQPSFQLESNHLSVEFLQFDHQVTLQRNCENSLRLCSFSLHSHRIPSILGSDRPNYARTDWCCILMDRMRKTILFSRITSIFVTKCGEVVSGIPTWASTSEKSGPKQDAHPISPLTSQTQLCYKFFIGLHLISVAFDVLLWPGNPFVCDRVEQSVQWTDCGQSVDDKRATAENKVTELHRYCRTTASQMIWCSRWPFWTLLA